MEDGRGEGGVEREREGEKQSDASKQVSAPSAPLSLCTSSSLRTYPHIPCTRVLGTDSVYTVVFMFLLADSFSFFIAFTAERKSEK